MEISPISGIRILPVAKVPPADSDLSRVQDIDNSSKPGEDTYSGGGKKSAGGQDDENEEAEENVEGQSSIPTSEDGPTAKINYFA